MPIRRTLLMVALAAPLAACGESAPEPAPAPDDRQQDAAVDAARPEVSEDARAPRGDGASEPAQEDAASREQPGPPPARAGDAFFRVDTFKLAAPGVVLRPAGIELPVTTQAQMGIDEALVSDVDPDTNGNGNADPEDGDGIVDLSLMIRFVGTSDPAKEAGRTTFGGGSCPHPYTAERVCAGSEDLPFQQATSAYENGVDCALEGTSHVARGPCFATDKGDITVTLPLLGEIPMQEGQVVGSWVNGGLGIESGAIRGFLAESVARETKLGDDLPPLAVSLDIKPGTALAEFLPNRERGMNAAGVSGWWFLMRFSAKTALYDEDAALPTK